MKTLAIFSPSQNAYSETFIQAHKKLPFNVKFYYGGAIPGALEGNDNILEISFFERIKRRLLTGFSFAEKRLIFSLRRQKVDCVLAEYGTTAAESLRVIQYLKLPLIVHFHGFDASVKPVIESYKERYKAVFNYASKVIVVSNKMHQALINMGCPKEKIIINYYGPDDSFLSAIPDFKRSQFISIGRFVEKKAPYLTIFSFKKVVDEYPNAKLIMVGEGELFDTCKSFANILNLQKNIEFKGVCTPDEIKELFEKSLAFIQHSITANNGDSEGTPVAVLEANAAGLPVIATHHAGIPDVVIHGETGLLVNEKDVEGMATNIKKILTEDGLAKKLGDAGRIRITENFTMKKHLKLIEESIDAATKYKYR